MKKVSSLTRLIPRISVFHSLTNSIINRPQWCSSSKIVQYKKVRIGDFLNLVQGRIDETHHLPSPHLRWLSNTTPEIHYCCRCYTDLST